MTADPSGDEADPASVDATEDVPTSGRDDASGVQPGPDPFVMLGQGFALLRRAGRGGRVRAFSRRILVTGGLLAAALVTALVLGRPRGLPPVT